MVASGSGASSTPVVVVEVIVAEAAAAKAARLAATALCGFHPNLLAAGVAYLAHSTAQDSDVQ